MNYNLYGNLKNIKCPTLIIHGEYDVIPTSAIEKMNSEINGCETHIIKNCGHFVHIERQKEYFDLIEKFLEKD